MALTLTANVYAARLIPQSEMCDVVAGLMNTGAFMRDNETTNDSERDYANWLQDLVIDVFPEDGPDRTEAVKASMKLVDLVYGKYRLVKYELISSVAKSDCIEDDWDFYVFTRAKAYNP